MEGSHAVRAMAKFYAQHGTVAFAPTTMTAAVEQISDALSGVEQARSKPQDDVALVLNAHLEGPFINPKRLGAQPDCVLKPDGDVLRRWLDIAPLSVATIAPELDGAMELVRLLRATGCKVQIGHSDATLEQASAALDAGVSGFTHLYNAMSQLKPRAPGVVGCALAKANHAEVICDLQHVKAAALRCAGRAIPFLYAITDSTAAAGRSDGEYKLGNQPVIKHGKTVRTKDGVLAGSAMTLWDARRTLIDIGFDEPHAQEMVSERPASYLGIDELGDIAIGKYASMVTIHADEIAQVHIRGLPIK